MSLFGIYKAWWIQLGTQKVDFLRQIDRPNEHQNISLHRGPSGQSACVSLLVNCHYVILQIFFDNFKWISALFIFCI